MSDQSYRFNWQNPELRKTIYPFREKKLRDFLLTYYEIDTWKNLKESDPEKDESYQQMRADLIDWTYERLNRIADYFRSEEILDPTRMEKLEQEKAFLLEHEDSFPRETRIRKRLEGLDGRGTQVFREATFAQYPQAVKKEYLDAIINEKDREHKEWDEELQTRLKLMGLVEAQTNLHSWWQHRVEEASQVVTEIGADLEKLKNLAALLKGEKQSIDHDDQLGQRVDELHTGGAIAAHVFKSGRYERREQCEYILALIDEKTQERTAWTKNPARLKEIDAQLANLRQLNHLLDQGRSILMSSQLRAGLGELDKIGQYLFKLERYTRYPQAYQNQYLAAVIDHNNRELQAWQKSLEYSQAKLKYETEKGSPLAAWWQWMVSKFERVISVIRSDLESLNKLKALLNEEQRSLDRERWIGRTIETLGNLNPGVQTPGRYPRDFVHRYLSVIMDARDRQEGAPTARSIPGNVDFDAQKITRVQQLLEEEQRILDQEELVSARDQIRKLAAALEPTHSTIFKSSRYTHSDQHGYLQKLVEEKTRAGVVGAGLDKLDQVKTLLDQENELLERKTRSLEHSRLIANKQQIVEAIGQQEAYIKNVLYSDAPETEKYSFLSRQIDAKLKERDALVNELNSRWRKNRDSWKQIEGEQGQNYRYWKRESDKRENELATIFAALTKLTDLKESLDEEKILSGQGQTISLSELIDQAMERLGTLEPIEVDVLASDKFSFTEKMDYLQALIAERSRERAEWAKELQARRRNIQLAGQGESLLAWWQEKAGQAERIVETIDTELNKLEALKKSYLPRKGAVDFREVRQEKSSLARLALLRKQNEVEEDILSSQKVQDENARHDQLLKMILEMFDAQPGRFPQWLQYMVIHFSGIRYKSAHGSWFDPGELLKVLRDEQPRLVSQNDGEPPRGNGASTTAGEVEATIPIPADAEALETLRGYKKHIPPWAWKEIARFTPLRLDTTDPGWEQAEPERRQFDTPDKRLWNGILNQWAREERITLWRERHENTLDVVMTSCVCNEIAENTLHTRGVKAAGGLTRKVDWYFKQARGTANRPDDDPLKAFFLRPATSGDFRPAASIFWLDWKPQCLYDDQAAQASQVYQHNLLSDGVTLAGKGVDAEGWRYAWESNRIIRRKLKYADPKNPNKFNKAQIDSVAEAERKSIEAKIRRENASLKDNPLEKAIQKALQKRKNAMKLEQVKQYLRWTHEAIVLGVEETLDGWQVLTFETAPDRTGLNRRNVGWLVNIDNNSTGQQVFVGYLAPLNDLPDDIVPNRILPGAYLPGETWASLQARLNEMLRRDLILPRGGYAAKTYPKEAPPQKEPTGRETGPGQASREALKALPGLWVEAAPRLDKKAPGKGWLNKPALECYAIGRKSMTKTKVALNRGWPLRVASTRKEKSRNVWHYLVTHGPDEPEAEGLYIREEDFIPIAPQRAGILVRTKRETKALSFKKTDDPGKPIPDSAGAKLPAGTQFLVSAVHRISDKDPDKYQPGTILITGGKPHYLVTDCPPNRDAEGLLVRASDIEELRVIPLDMDDILKRRREAQKDAQDEKAPRGPQWSVVTPSDEGEARLFAKIGTARKPGLARQSLSLKAGMAVQVAAPQTVNEKDVCRILACPQESGAAGKYVLAKDLTRAVQKILSKDVLLAAIKSALKHQAGAGSDLQLRLEAQADTQPRHRLVASITAGGVSHALELHVSGGRLVIANGDPASPGEQTNHWSATLAASLETAARPQPDSKLLTALVSVDPGSGQQQLALYWQGDT